MVEKPKSKTGQFRRARGTISAAEIINAAFDVARETGVDGLTMPKLASTLEIGVASIYWYFRSKEELLDALTGEATKKFHSQLTTMPAQSWDELTLSYFRRFREIATSDDVLCDLVLLRGAPFSSVALERIWPGLETVLGAHVKAGFTLRESTDNYFTLSLYTRGTIILDRQHRAANMVPYVPVRLPAEFDSGSFPILNEVSSWHSLRGITDSEFENGLQAMVQGMQSRLFDKQSVHDSRRMDTTE